MHFALALLVLLDSGEPGLVGRHLGIASEEGLLKSDVLGGEAGEPGGMPWDVVLSASYTVWSHDLRLRNGAGWGLAAALFQSGKLEEYEASGTSSVFASIRGWRVDDLEGGGKADVVNVGFSGFSTMVAGINHGMWMGLGFFLTPGVTLFYTDSAGGLDHVAPTATIETRAMLFGFRGVMLGVGLAGDSIVTSFHQDRTEVLGAFSMTVSFEVIF